MFGICYLISAKYDRTSLIHNYDTFLGEDFLNIEGMLIQVSYYNNTYTYEFFKVGIYMENHSTTRIFNRLYLVYLHVGEPYGSIRYSKPQANN